MDSAAQLAEVPGAWRSSAKVRFLYCRRVTAPEIAGAHVRWRDQRQPALHTNISEPGLCDNAIVVGARQVANLGGPVPTGHAAKWSERLFDSKQDGSGTGDPTSLQCCEVQTSL
jgi:hypothetical protein